MCTFKPTSQTHTTQHPTRTITIAAAWQGPIHGAKLFALLPPLGREDRGGWLPSGPLGEEVLERLLLPPPQEMFTQSLPWIAANAAPVLSAMRHCVVRPGDAIFIPCNWFHATYNLEPTAAAGAQADTPSSAHCPDDAFGAAFNMFRRAGPVGARDVAALRAACDANRFHHECAAYLAEAELGRGGGGGEAAAALLADRANMYVFSIMFRILCKQHVFCEFNPGIANARLLLVVCLGPLDSLLQT